VRILPLKTTLDTTLGCPRSQLLSNAYPNQKIGPPFPFTDLERPAPMGFITKELPGGGGDLNAHHFEYPSQTTYRKHWPSQQRLWNLCFHKTFVLRASFPGCPDQALPYTHPSLVIFISYHTNEREYYNSGALLLLSHQVLINVVMDSVYCDQRS
jgi:hypothetical protein